MAGVMWGMVCAVECLGVLVSCLGETRNTCLNLTKFPRNSPFGQKELGTT